MPAPMDSNTSISTPEVSSIATPISDFILGQLKMHGLPMAMLAVAVWYFMGENKQIKSDIHDCNSTLIEMYKTDRIQQLEVINNNTAALRELKLLHDQ